jgi:hypothetical protein
MPSVPEDRAVVYVSSSETRAVVGKTVTVRVTAATRSGSCLARCREKPYEGQLRLLEASCPGGGCTVLDLPQAAGNALYFGVAPLHTGPLRLALRVATAEGTSALGVHDMEVIDPPEIHLARTFGLGKDVPTLPGIAFPFEVLTTLDDGYERSLAAPGLELAVEGDAVAVEPASRTVLGSFLLRTLHAGDATLVARAGRTTFTRRVHVVDPSEVARIEFREYGPHPSADAVAFDDEPLGFFSVEVDSTRAVVPVAVLRDGRLAHMPVSPVVSPESVAGAARPWVGFEAVIAGRALGLGVLRVSAGNASAGLPFEVVPSTRK